MTKIFVYGVGLLGSGYPNAEQTILILRERLGWQVQDNANWLPEGTTLWKKARGARVGLVLFLARLAISNAVAAIRLLLNQSARNAWIYVPYPSIFLLWWLSWMPGKMRPKIIADAYISLWDSAFRDRSLLADGGVVSRLARWFEARGLGAADAVLVDTVANREWAIEMFGLSRAKVYAIPLAIDTVAMGAGTRNGWADETEAPHVSRPLRILFVGTLAPLHGIDVVAGAIRRLLAEDRDLVLHVVGDGQERAVLEKLAADIPHGRLHWERDWMPVAEIAKRMEESDICLGVFGGNDKAGRVLPFKVYLALAAGRPVVTQSSYSLPADVPALPAVLVEAEPGLLAKALALLANDRPGRVHLGRQGRSYYCAHLGPEALAAAWEKIVGGIEDGGG